jgi:hypothetical protein
MTISDKLRYLGETKTLIKEAIQNKGVPVSDTDPFRTYADKISQIQAGGGSGGSGGEVIEAIVDESALPIEADKKVVVANIQATGQGAGALMPFDIVPYSATSGSVNSLLQLRGEYSLHVNTTNSSGPAHIGYKKVGDRWEGKYFTKTITGITNPNDAFNLLYDNSNYRYFSGSSGKYWNPIKEQEETITFDEPLTGSLIANVTTRYFLTYDSKYLWAVHLNVSSTNQSDANKGLICLYEITIDDATGEVFAHKKTEEIEIEMLARSYQGCTCSLNHYGIIVYAYNSPYTMTYVQFDEAENTLAARTGTGFWGNSYFNLLTFTKDWLTLCTTNTNGTRVYWGDIFSGRGISGDFGRALNVYEIARFGNTFYPLANYYDGVGSTSMTFVKMPVDKEQPVPDDFIFYTVTCSSPDVGPYMIDEENCIMGSSWQYDCTQALMSYNIPNNINRKESDPGRVPVMLFDDGSGYFYRNNSNIYNWATVVLTAPVEGSYNNGTVLKTIDPQSLSPSATPFYKLINTASTQSGQGFRFGTLPMNYINEGNSFIFHNYCTGSSASDGVTFFKNTSDDPQTITSLHINRGVRVSQNKAYITSYWASSSDKLNEIIMIDGEGIHTYQSKGPSTSQGVYFEFEGDTYSYPLMKRASFYGKQDNEYLKLHFDSETMVCTIEKLGNTEMDYLNQMGQYVTGTDMAPSNPYPETGYNSLYNMPVITKDSKYFVGLAGNHTTHYAKIEKHESGYPMLNVYEFPDILKNLLYEQEILYFEAYYPSGFGIQLANGTFLLCEYEQGLDVDLTITTYKPAHSYTFNSWNQCLMHFTSHKHYWYFSTGTYWGSYPDGSIGGYAGCGRREDLPSTYQTKVYSMQHSFAGSDHVTGYLTGKSYTDENDKLIAEVEVLRK